MTSASGDTGASNSHSSVTVSRPTVDHPYLIEPNRISSRNYYDIEQFDFNRAPFLSGATAAAMLVAATAPTAVAQLKAPPLSSSSSAAAAAATTQFQRLGAAAATAAVDGSSSSSANSLLYSDGESSPPPIVVGSRIAQQHPQQQQQRIINNASAAAPATAVTPSRPQPHNNRSKQSVENLSEDSGYGDQHHQPHVYGQLRQRSRSIPNFTHGDQRYLIAEEPLLTHGACDGSDYWAADMMHKSLEHIGSANRSTAASQHAADDDDGDVVDGGENGRRSHASATTETTTPEIDNGEARLVAVRRGGSSSRSDDADNCDHNRSTAPYDDAHSDRRRATQRTAVEPAPAHISASLPDILEHISAFGENNGSFDSIGSSRSARTRTHSHQHRHQPAAARQRSTTTTTTTTGHAGQARHHRINVYSASPPVDRRSLLYRPDFSIVSSVPSCLNICITSTSNGDYDDHTVLDRHWNVSTSAASANSTSTTRHGAVVVVGVSKNTSARRTAAAAAASASTSVASRNLDLRDFDTATGTTTKKTSHSFGATFEAGAQPPPAVSGKQIKVINASYSNLTVLDYSGRRPSAAAAAIQTFRAMAEQRKKQQQQHLLLHRHIEENDEDDAQSQHQPLAPQPLQLCKGNFLLDEISAHFDRNLSILNDRNELSDAATDQLIDQLASASVVQPQPARPVAPPRRLSKPLATQSASASIIDLQPATYSYTFDRDPTNLVTAYAASLERCNFELNTSAPNVNEEPQPTAASGSGHLQYHQHSQPAHEQHLVPAKRREIKVSSTPNLCLTETTDEHHVSAAAPATGTSPQHRRHQHATAAGESFMQTASTHTSLGALPSSAAAAAASSSASTDGGLQGILATAGSRNSLGKGVSFCPVVSEISWKEQSSEEYVADDR